MAAAAGVLDVDARRRLLRQVPETGEAAEFVACLIGKNPDLYRALLRDERLQPYHMVPLAGHPEGEWIEMAKLALDAGYSSKEVALAIYGFGMEFGWIGSESEMWSGWVERFERLCSHEDERIREVGEMGKAHMEENLRRALNRERQEAIYGI